VAPEDQAIVDAKRALRAEAAALRRKAVAALPPTAAGNKLRDILSEAIALPRGAPVSAYWPLETELDTRPIIRHLHAVGHPIGLPVVVGRGQPLAFRRWHPGMEMAAGAFRVLTPPPEAPELTPAVMLVPLLAFDAAGFRLGYGGGFYDRTIEQLRGLGHVLCIGIAYAAQEVPAVPREPTDQPLDWIVTEAGARRIGGTFGSGNRY
jgi:5-formyltetrahydrofolate cyclo-ligase